MPRYRFRGHEPQIPASTFVAETASVIGRVILGENTSVWPGR
jgi:carbonic anhydrase/acetyltransferase-like protein (isoleucine patch superfamily)